MALSVVGDGLRMRRAPDLQKGQELEISAHWYDAG
jgi:hypothetical protein